MKQYKDQHTIEKRIRWILFFFFTVMLILVVRLFIVQVVEGEKYRAYADRQQGARSAIETPRGSVFATNKDGEKIPLASNRLYKNIILAPNRVVDQDRVVRAVSEAAGVLPEDVESRLQKKDDPYEIAAKKLVLTDEVANALEAIPGVILEDDIRRVYPYGSLGARFLGFVAGDDGREEGKYGLERFYDEFLSGSAGLFSGVADARGFFLALGRKIIQSSRGGSDVYLTIDYNIQDRAQRALEAAAEKWEASSGSVLVIEPATGRILAMDAIPSYNPNEFNKERDLSIFLNPVVESVYEPGSVMKPVTMASALEEKKVTPETTYTDYGFVRVRDREIKNFDGKARGVQTMTQVLEKSLNTGAVHIAKLLGQEKQKEYIQKFGFGEKAGIDLPGELASNIENLLRGHEVEYATASFGQGIAVTPLQMALAMGAIANNGKLVKPYIVESVRADDTVLLENIPEVRREVISPATAETLTRMLVTAVQNGFVEKRPSLNGYFIAAKTGTAEIPRRDGKGYSDETIHTLIGYAPAFEPRFLIYLELGEPKLGRFSSLTLATAFYDLTEYMLNYYEIPPNRK